MAENNRKVVEQEAREEKTQPTEGKKTPPSPKRITEWIALDDTNGGAICDLTTGQCSV